MFLCPICKIDFKDDQRSYQRHFGFLNANETRHQEIKTQQEKVAIELFKTDLSGDTFHILKTHPEISLISEKHLRKLWKGTYGSEAIEKRRAKISFEKRNTNDYEPARQRNLIGKDVQCILCDKKFENQGEMNHHIAAMGDDVHSSFYNEQKSIAEEIFKKDTSHSFEDIPKHYPEFKLSYVTFKNFIKQNFSKHDIKTRQYKISSKNRIGVLPWNNGLDKSNNAVLEELSDYLQEKFKEGIPGLKGTELSKLLVKRHIDNPSISKKQSQTMKNGYASGRIKISHARGGISKKLGHYVRSSWELKFGLILKKLNIKYEYEPTTFSLTNIDGEIISTYTPDFFIPSKNIYYELKGVFSSSKGWQNDKYYKYKRFKDSADKITLFKQQYPNLKLRIIGKKEYKRIIDRFKNLLTNDKIDIEIVDGEINISKEEWKLLNFENEKEIIKTNIVSTIMENKLNVPYRQISIDDAYSDFSKLITLNESSLLVQDGFSSRYHYKYPMSKKYINSEKTGISSSNFFQQVNRFKCDSINAPSPERVWSTDRLMRSALNGLWSMKYDHVDNNILRECISVRKYVASQFKPSVAKYIYNTYGNNGDVLDFSAGWGDRLAGFYASNCKSYTGIDPNINVYNSYKEQIKLYEEFIHKDVELINEAAEDVTLDRKFDLIFTSPPYFDLERYSDDKNQSWVRYKTLNDWLDSFLFKAIHNSWDNLKVGGYLILNISDVYCHHKIQNICDPMNDFIRKLKGAEYQETIGMRIAIRPNRKISDGILAEPIWIWKKFK